MNIKLLIPLAAFGLILIMGIYFLINPSYEKSLEAKYYYETGDYHEAYALSKEAFGMDVYNRMASTIMAQSKTALKYVAYIEMAKKYIAEVNGIASHERISDSDKAKIRIICQIMVSSYVKLAPSVITDKKLIEDSKKYYEKFEKLLEKVD